LRPLREVELAAAMGVGRFSFRDYLVADGRMPAAPTAGVPMPEMASIQAALLECAVEQLQEKAQAVRDCLTLVGSIEAGLLGKVGPVHAIGFAPLTDLLREMDGILTSSLLQRGGDDPVAAVGAATAGVDTGQVKSREDVIRLLDRACDYFQRHEPSSPVPLLLKRAKGLVDKEFLEIMRDLAPGGVTEAEKILGRDAK
jgi:type VI secretion system protein ImpA